MTPASAYLTRPPRPGDIEAIAPVMSAMEARECAAFGHTPLQGLKLSMLGATRAWTLEVAGVPRGLMGVGCGDLMSGLGRPWFLGTEGAWRNPRAFVQIGRDITAQMAAEYPRLENWAHKDNLMTFRWLRALGFDVSDELVHIGGEPFRRFSLGL